MVAVAAATAAFAVVSVAVAAAVVAVAALTVTAVVAAVAALAVAVVVVAVAAVGSSSHGSGGGSGSSLRVFLLLRKVSKGRPVPVCGMRASLGDGAVAKLVRVCLEGSVHGCVFPHRSGEPWDTGVVLAIGNKKRR